MVFNAKMVSVACLLAVCFASFTLADHEPEHYAYPKYQFQYGVNDYHTGDIKEQSEARDGDTVHGHYTLVEPDGSSRSVHYTADKTLGFVAHATRDGQPLYAPGPKSSPLAFHASVGYGQGHINVDRSH